MIGVRFREDTGFEGKCDYCGSWWPLDMSHWQPSGGMRRCLGCMREYKRLHEQGRSADEAVRELKNANSRIQYRLNREARRAANKAWKDANRDRIREYNRQYRERQRAA